VGAGLVLAYILNLWLIHWPGAAIYLLPWYAGSDPQIIEVGFRQSTIAILAFGVGCAFVAPAVLRVFRYPAADLPARIPQPVLGKVYIGLGLVSYFVVLPLADVIPSATSLAAAGWNLVIVGLALSCWSAWQKKQKRRFLAWVAASLALPFLTTVSEGFLGYGTFALITVLTFVSVFYRPRWQIVVTGILLGYLGFSLFISYMRDRTEIREVVWSGASIGDRLERVFATVTSFEWFDPYDNSHLFRVDERLNQNYLVGTCVRYLEGGFEGFARGETIWLAGAALVPRVLWPNKPVIGGSGDLVTHYTGIEFAEGTSVGVGQVLEFYINFGTMGVFVGFLCLGVIVTFFDSAAWQYLVKGDWQGFTMWFLPALGLLQAGGSLVEVTSSTGAGMVTAWLVNRQLLPRLRGKLARSPQQGAPRVSMARDRSGSLPGKRGPV